MKHLGGPQEKAKIKPSDREGFSGYSGLFPSVIPPLLRHHNHIVSPFRKIVKFFFVLGIYFVLDITV